MKRGGNKHAPSQYKTLDGVADYQLVVELEEEINSSLGIRNGDPRLT